MRLLSIDDSNKTVEVDLNLEGFEKQISDLMILVNDLSRMVNDQQIYIDLLKSRIEVKANSVCFVHNNKRVGINDNNAFKNVGYGDEVLAGENWINNEFSSFNRVLKVREVWIGNNETEAYLRIYRYARNQMILGFENGDVHNIIAPNDKRIKWSGGQWYFT